MIEFLFRNDHVEFSALARRQEWKCLGHLARQSLAVRVLDLAAIGIDAEHIAVTDLAQQIHQ